MSEWKRQLGMALAFGALAMLVGTGACDGGGRSGNVDDDSGTSSSAASTGAAGSVPGGPDVTVVASPESMTEGESVTFNATLFDDDGLDDIVGGVLKDAGGSVTYLPFERLSAGTFSATLSWSELNAIEAIDFEGQSVKMFRAEFHDTTLKFGFATVAVTLTCSSMGVAENGICTAACSLPVPDPTTCMQACSVLYDCGALSCSGMKACPGFTGDAADKAAFVGSDSSGCTLDCDLHPYHLMYADPSDCTTTIAEMKAFDRAGFAVVCETGN